MEISEIIEVLQRAEKGKVVECKDEYENSHKTLSAEIINNNDLLIQIDNIKPYYCMGIRIDKSEAIQLRDFLNEFIEEQNES